MAWDGSKIQPCPEKKRERKAMPDNSNNVEMAPVADAPLLPRNSYPQGPRVEAPNDGGKAYGNQARIALLRDWRRIIYRHRWLILSIVLVALSFTIIQAYRVKPIYQAATTIDMSRENSSLSKGGDVILFGSNDNTKAEAIIIKSLPVLKKTILNLNLDKNPHFLDVTAKRSITEALLSLKGGPPEYENELALEDVKDAVEKDIDKDERAIAAGTANPDSGNSYADRKTMLANKRAERIKLAPYIQTLLDNLKVEGVRETRLVKISFTHTSPEIAARVANGIADSFISHNFQMKTERFTNTSKWLEESTRKLKSQVEQSEQKLANYSRANNIFSLEG